MQPLTGKWIQKWCFTKLFPRTLISPLFPRSVRNMLCLFLRATDITGNPVDPIVASSRLSIQWAELDDVLNCLKALCMCLVCQMPSSDTNMMLSVGFIIHCRSWVSFEWCLDVMWPVKALSISYLWRFEWTWSTHYCSPISWYFVEVYPSCLLYWWEKTSIQLYKVVLKPRLLSLSNNIQKYMLLFSRCEGWV